MKLTEFHQSCPQCGGPAFSDLTLAEKKDACYHKVKASAKVWPSAYASGRLVQCRKKGAANYGNKSEGVAEGLFGIEDKIKGRIQNVVSDLSDIPGMWDHQRQTFTDTGMEKLKSVLKNNPKYIKYALNLTYKDYEAEGVAEQQLDEKCWDGYQQQGMKNKGGRQVPNCVPLESIKEDPMNIDNAEYNDEAGMADNNLETLARAVEGIDDLIQSGDNLPEWCQEKIAVAKSMLVSVWDYMYSEEASDEVDPEIDAMFEAMQGLVTEMAQKNRVSEDLVWETFEAMPDNILYETAAWRRKEGKSAKGGLNAKGVASYRRENPGSKLQMAVTTKPSKLKPGSKAAKRRKSFCARMSGVKGPMKKPNGKPTRKALALRKWNC